MACFNGDDAFLGNPMINCESKALILGCKAFPGNCGLWDGIHRLWPEVEGGDSNRPLSCSAVFAHRFFQYFPLRFSVSVNFLRTFPKIEFSHEIHNKLSSRLCGVVFIRPNSTGQPISGKSAVRCRSHTPWWTKAAPQSLESRFLGHECRGKNRRAHQ